MKVKLKLLCAVTAALLLAACGGGGGDSSPAPAPIAKAEGVYQGTTSTGLQFSLLVLENDQFYSLVGTTSGGVFFVSSLVDGQGNSNNGSFSASGVNQYFGDGQVIPGTVASTYTPRVSIAGTLSQPSFGNSTFNGTAPANTTYVYDTPANLSGISGAWSGGDLSGEGVNFSITAGGAISGTSALGCSFTGSVAPRASGKNVFNTSVTFGSAPCDLPGQTAQGIALTFLLANGQRQLLVAITNSARTAGTAVFAQR